MKDLDLVESALKRLRNLAREYQYGGLNDLYELAQEALEKVEEMKGAE